MRDNTRLALATAVAAIMLLPVAALGTSATASKWTILMYFGADNDLYQATEFAVSQTQKALLEQHSSDVSVVVLFDGPENGDTRVWDLSDGTTVDWTNDALKGDHERSMTDNDTLVEFLEWAFQKDAYYGKDTNVMLILKNGHAWCGICPDETDNDGDETILMPVNDLKGALDKVYKDVEGAWVDALVFDADNMGSIEVAYELRTVTSYFVGSQQQVPLEGLPYYLFMTDLVDYTVQWDIKDACINMTKDYVKYYNNTAGTKGLTDLDKLLANSQMYVTAAVFQMGVGGRCIEAVVDAFNNYTKYLIDGTLPDYIVDAAERQGLWEENLTALHDKWYYPDPSHPDELVWSWIPLSRNNISSARDCALIGKINDQQGYEWLPDVYTWLWSLSALSNYDTYLDAVYLPERPIEDVAPQPLWKLSEPFVRLLLEDFMKKFGYVEPGIYRGIWSSENLNGEGALVWVSQSKILDRSGNSFPHGLNIWFPPTWLQWDEDDEWTLLFTKEMTYTYTGIGVWLGTDIEILLPAEYYCIDCPYLYQDEVLGLDFPVDTVWMDFFEVYYDSRWDIYGGDTGSHDDSKP